MAIQADSNKIGSNLKFLCSYGGKIRPRPSDGRLRYVGGLTRVLSVNRSISYAELMLKLGDFCGFSVTMRCQLPNGDLETLISVRSDEDLTNLIDEYDRVCSNSPMIRTILTPTKSVKQISPPSSTDLSPKSPVSAFGTPPGSRSQVPAYSFSRRTSRVGCYGCGIQGISRPPYQNSPTRCSHFWR